jgi:hypothetical protein
MKHLLLLPLCALVLSMGSGCRKVNEATEFDIQYATTVNVPKGSVKIDTTVDFTTPEVPTESSSYFANNQTAEDLIEEVALTRFVITSQSGGNLDYLKSLSVYIKAPNLNDLLVATKSNIPPGTTSFSADMTGANIREHLFKDKIQFRLSVTVKSLPPEDQTLKLEQTVHVKGKKIK